MKKVMVFTESALAISETFIADHCLSLSRYEPILMASVQIDNYMPTEFSIEFPFGRCGPSFLERVAFRLGYSSKIDAAIADIKPDLIHAHYLTNGAFLLPFAKRHNIPLVITVHGYDVTRKLRLSSLYDMILRFRKNRISYLASAILPVSMYLRDKLRDQGISGSNVRTHYLGIFQDTEEKRARAGSDSVRIVFAGRLVEKKGIDRVLEAFGAIRNSFPECELHIVGDGPLRQKVEEAKKIIGGVVTYGALPHAELLKVIESAQIFTMPSREAANGDAEGFGLTLVEAQAAGVPVVTSRQTGTGETCADGETGILVDSDDVDGLAAAFAALLNDDKRRAEMGEAAKIWAREHFDIRKQTSSLENIYDEILDRFRGIAEE